MFFIRGELPFDAMRSIKSFILKSPSNYPSGVHVSLPREVRSKYAIFGLVVSSGGSVPQHACAMLGLRVHCTLRRRGNFVVKH
jgi:hypothetical protein